MDKETILTGERSEDDIKQEEAMNLDWERFSILLDLCYEHYIANSTKPDLAKLCRMIVTIGEDFDGDELHHIPSKGRNRLTGEIITKAVKFDNARPRATGKKEKVSNEKVFASLIKSLVQEAYSRGHKKNKTLKTGKANMPNAYEVVADLLYKYGITTKDSKKYAISTISNWSK